MVRRQIPKVAQTPVRRSESLPVTRQKKIVAADGKGERKGFDLIHCSGGPVYCVESFVGVPERFSRLEESGGGQIARYPHYRQDEQRQTKPCPHLALD
jgi:hypothetical protein